ncbi:MAG TPA: hypothetical protein PLS51_05860 [Flavobacterium sp.]|jgi:hypothetical protein|nr:hypothetical protein [Flavobacterium sp.]HPJ10135.1 hypothetical protein [Flavobacterium sp.]
METKDYLKDIRDIKEMMAQSTQFISLSGLSGIMAGFYALIGAYLADRILPANGSRYDEIALPAADARTLTAPLIGIALGIIALSVVTGFLLSSAKAKRQGNSLWNSTSKRLVINFSIPLIAGGIFGLLLIDKKYYELIVPILLIFYGMACVNASKFTFRDVRYLGLTLMVLGLLATAFTNHDLLFFSIGFGLCHIVYGAVMYFKYDSK